MFNNVKGRTDVEFMDYLLSGLNTLLLLDYHFLDQGFAFEVRDGSIAVSHITMGMESGTQADVDSSRGCPDAALECAPAATALRSNVPGRAPMMACEGYAKVPMLSYNHIGAG